MAKPLGAMRGTRIGSNPAGPRLDGTTTGHEVRITQTRLVIIGTQAVTAGA